MIYLRKPYPLSRLLAELKDEFKQNEDESLSHLEKCRQVGLIVFDDKYVYGYVDILQPRD